ncbi:MAG: KH domain-containing protein, partial [Bacilli bacterium]|nr:KH domain-containing protein [Bacilli bacterium]
MHQELINFTENLVRSLVKEPDMVKVQEFLGDEEVIQLEIIVHEDDMGSIIGKGGKMASALRVLI